MATSTNNISFESQKKIEKIIVLNSYPNSPFTGWKGAREILWYKKVGMAFPSWRWEETKNGAKCGKRKTRRIPRKKSLACFPCSRFQNFAPRPFLFLRGCLPRPNGSKRVGALPLFIRNLPRGWGRARNRSIILIGHGVFSLLLRPFTSLLLFYYAPMIVSLRHFRRSGVSIPSVIANNEDK